MGFINPSGQVVIAPHYDRVGDFDGGVALVQMNDLNGFINASGQVIWAPSK